MYRWATRQVHVKHYYYYILPGVYTQDISLSQSITYIYRELSSTAHAFPVQMRHIAHSVTVLARPIQDTVGISYDVLGCSCLAKHCVQAAGGIYVGGCVRMCTCLCVCEHGRNAENAVLTV